MLWKSAESEDKLYCFPWKLCLHLEIEIPKSWLRREDQWTRQKRTIYCHSLKPDYFISLLPWWKLPVSINRDEKRCYWSHLGQLDPRLAITTLRFKNNLCHIPSGLDKNDKDLCMFPILRRNRVLRPNIPIEPVGFPPPPGAHLVGRKGSITVGGNKIGI